MKNLLEGKPVDFEKTKKEILASKTAAHMKKIQHVDDLGFCLQLDSDNVVPIVEKKDKMFVVRALQ